MQAGEESRQARFFGVGAWGRIEMKMYTRTYRASASAGPGQIPLGDSPEMD